MTNYNNLGLYIYENFISDDEHNSLIEEIKKELSESISKAPKRYSDRNRVVRYGDLSICDDNYCRANLPYNIDKIAEQLVSNEVLRHKPDAININEYLIGDFIRPHIDRKAHGPIVTILSVNSTATMLFQNTKSSKDNFEIVMRPKDILQMKDSIRWEWMHSIYPVQETRYSIVFRNTLE
jgi:alkylated DNA repair dioxygenase AlkB